MRVSAGKRLVIIIVRWLQRSVLKIPNMKLRRAYGLIRLPRTILYSIINSVTCRKVLLSGFPLNGHMLGLYPQTKNIGATLYSIINRATGKYCSVTFV